MTTMKEIDKEIEELEARLTEVTNYIDTKAEVVDTIGHLQYDLLLAQEKAMQVYLTILQARREALK